MKKITFLSNLVLIPCRGIVEFPGIRAAHQGAQLGRNAQPGRAPLHGASPLAGLLAGAFPDNCRLLPQHVRRRSEGPAGSQTEGRSGKLRHQKTQTRHPGPTALPFQLVSGQKEPLPFSFMRIAVFSASSILGHREDSSPRGSIPFLDLDYSYSRVESSMRNAARFKVQSFIIRY